MNEWATRTLKLVENEDYLDRLQSIYPHEDVERDVEDNVLDSIRSAFEERHNTPLLNTLLDLEKFPYKDSYVGFLRRDRGAIERNPQTVARICNRLYDMGIDGVIMGATAAKEANTRRGNQFANWTRSKFKFVSEFEFKKSGNGIVMLDASEATARDFCNKEMGVGIAKRPDMVAKSGRRYVIGEAKFLSSTGGNQGRGFEDGMKLATNAEGRTHKVFVLDGIHWIEKGSAQHKQIDYSNAQVFSALILEDYLRSVS